MSDLFEYKLPPEMIEPGVLMQELEKKQSLMMQKRLSAQLDGIEQLEFQVDMLQSQLSRINLGRNFTFYQSGSCPLTHRL